MAATSGRTRSTTTRSTSTTKTGSERAMRGTGPVKKAILSAAKSSKDPLALLKDITLYLRETMAEMREEIRDQKASGTTGTRRGSANRSTRRASSTTTTTPTRTRRATTRRNTSGISRGRRSQSEQIEAPVMNGSDHSGLSDAI